MRHIGRDKANDARYAVVSMALPNDTDHCLVVEIDSLPIKYQDALMNVVYSKDAQSETKLLNILSRRRFDDGRFMSEVLHESGRLKRVKTDSVLMTPDNSTRIALDELNRRIESAEKEKLGKKAETVERTSNVQENLKVEQIEERKKIARKLLLEADLIMQQAIIDVEAKKEAAYKYDPSLRSPTFTETAENVEPVNAGNAENSDDELTALLEGPVEGPFVDDATGKEYKTAAALKAAITRRQKKGA